MNKVVIIQQVIANYRIPFFNELSNHIDIELYASYSGLEKNMLTSTTGANFKINMCKNISLLNKLTQYIKIRSLKINEDYTFSWKFLKKFS